MDEICWLVADWAPERRLARELSAQANAGAAQAAQSATSQQISSIVPTKPTKG